MHNHPTELAALREERDKKERGVKRQEQQQRRAEERNERQRKEEEKVQMIETPSTLETPFTLETRLNPRNTLDLLPSSSLTDLNLNPALATASPPRN